MTPKLKFFAGALVLTVLTGCKPSSAPAVQTAATAPVAPTPPSPYTLTASIQELMDSIVDPNADELWDSVATVVTKKGVEERQPRTDEEWTQQRRHAIALIESTNLLAMPGRKLVPAGGKVLDQGFQGVLTPEAGQKKLDEQHETFVGFAHALRDVGEKFMAAIDAKNTQAMMDAGAEMDEVCEGCHLTFWYPDQKIPDLPANVPPTQRAAKVSR